MPHIDIKCFPRELDEQQKAALAADITDVIIRHLNSKDSSISIALQQIQPNLGKLSGMPKSRPKWRL